MIAAEVLLSDIFSDEEVVWISEIFDQDGGFLMAGTPIAG